MKCRKKESSKALVLALICSKILVDLDLLWQCCTLQKQNIFGKYKGENPLIILWKKNDLGGYLRPFKVPKTSSR